MRRGEPPASEVGSGRAPSHEAEEEDDNPTAVPGSRYTESIGNIKVASGLEQKGSGVGSRGRAEVEMTKVNGSNGRSRVSNRGI